MIKNGNKKWNSDYEKFLEMMRYETNIVDFDICGIPTATINYSDSFLTEIYNMLRDRDDVFFYTEDTHKDIDFTVESAKPNSRGKTDDEIYLCSVILQYCLPRGYTILKQDDGNIRIISFGNRKFTGKNSGDDDDTEKGSAIPEGATHFVLTYKANGDMVHISAFVWNGKIYISIGSKLRKMVIDLSKFSEYLNYYSSKEYLKRNPGKKYSPYHYAHIGATIFFENYWNKWDKSTQDEFITFLISKEGLTLNFEMEDPNNQHMEVLSEARLVLIGVSSPYFFEKFQNPVTAQKLASKYGFPSVCSDVDENGDIKYYSLSELPEKEKELREEENREGAVIVLFDENGNVLTFLKVKTYWYILMRYVRSRLSEYFKNKDGFTPKTLKSFLKSLEDGLHQKIKSFNGSLYCKMSLFNKYLAFAKWLLYNNDFTSQNFISNFRGNFLEYYTEFNVLPKSETYTSIFLSSGEISLKHNFYSEESITKFFIALQGLPGLGKSYMCSKFLKQYKAYYSKLGYHVEDVSLDGEITKLNKSNSKVKVKGKQKTQARKNLKSIIAELFKNHPKVIVILDMNNSTERDFQDLLPSSCANFKLCLVSTKDDLKDSSVINFCKNSCLTRRQCDTDKSHPLSKVNQNNIEKTVNSFSKRFRKFSTPYELQYLTVKASNNNNNNNNSDDSLERRDINMVVEELKTIVEDIMENGSNVDYSYSPADGSYVSVNMEDGTHCTLKYFKNGANVSQDVKELYSELLGTDVTVNTTNKYIHTNKNGVLEVSPVTDLLTSKNVDLSDKVASGFPHITESLTGKRRGYESVKVLNCDDDNKVVVDYMTSRNGIVFYCRNF